MAWDFKKIYAGLRRSEFKINSFNFLSASPKTYWPWLMIFALILASGTIILNIYFFRLFTRLDAAYPAMSTGEMKRVYPKINRGDLETAIETIEKRESQFQKEIERPKLSDPAL